MRGICVRKDKKTGRFLYLPLIGKIESLKLISFFQTVVARRFPINNGREWLCFFTSGGGGKEEGGKEEPLAAKFMVPTPYFPNDLP